MRRLRYPQVEKALPALPNGLLYVLLPKGGRVGALPHPVGRGPELAAGLDDCIPMARNPPATDPLVVGQIAKDIQLDFCGEMGKSAREARLERQALESACRRRDGQTKAVYYLGRRGRRRLLELPAHFL